MAYATRRVCISKDVLKAFLSIQEPEGDSSGTAASPSLVSGVASPSSSVVEAKEAAHAHDGARRPPIAVAAVDAAWADPCRRLRASSGLLASQTGTSGSGGQMCAPVVVGGMPRYPGEDSGQAGWWRAPRTHLATVTRRWCFDPSFEGLLLTGTQLLGSCGP